MILQIKKLQVLSFQILYFCIFMIIVLIRKKLSVSAVSYQEEKKLLDLIYQVQEETPFTALGFFDVDRSTLTSILATSATYIIILLQFDQ